MSRILEIKDLVKYYKTGETVVKAVDHVNLGIERGRFTAIVGRSGSGKSTLLHLIGGLDRADSGQVLIEGTNLFSMKPDDLAVYRRQKIGFIFQDYNLIPSLTVWENVVLPLGLDGRRVKVDEVTHILERIGLADKREFKPSMLSGGQKQRCAIARALVTTPSIILADEPTGNLDSETELEVMNLLKSCITEFGQTLVMITHDEVIAQMADDIILISDGKVVTRR